MAWIYILLAGLEEVISVVAMKYVDGFKHKKPIAVMGVGFMASFYFCRKQCRKLQSVSHMLHGLALAPLELQLLVFCDLKKR